METTLIKLSGLNCSTCAVDIDLNLEEISGVKSSNTNYQKSETKVSFDKNITNIEAIKKTITDLGYKTD